MKNPNQGGSRSTPTHFYLDHTPYFISAATYRHQRLLDDDLKGRLVALLHTVYAEFGWRLEHWVILDAHYHLLAHSQWGADLTKIVNKVHGLSARGINKRHPPQRRAQRQMWCNYWDYCPRSEQEYHTRLCYQLNNPVKHGYVESLHGWP